MKDIEEKIEMVRKALFEKFPNAPHTIIMHLWDDGDYQVTARYGDEESIHNFSYYTQDDFITYEKDKFLSSAIKEDKYGNQYYVPEELIGLLNKEI